MNMNAKLTDTVTLKRVLPLVVAAYRDYRHYYFSLESLSENFDESLEHFDTTTWYNMILRRDDTDDYAMDCIESLNHACCAFDEISVQAKEGLTILLSLSI